MLQKKDKGKTAARTGVTQPKHTTGWATAKWQARGRLRDDRCSWAKGQWPTRGLDRVGWARHQRRCWATRGGWPTRVLRRWLPRWALEGHTCAFLVRHLGGRLPPLLAVRVG